jgi:hypothetical protein
MEQFVPGPGCRSESASGAERLEGPRNSSAPISAARVALAEAVARRNALADDTCAVRNRLYQ